MISRSTTLQSKPAFPDLIAKTASFLSQTAYKRIERRRNPVFLHCISFFLRLVTPSFLGSYSDVGPLDPNSYSRGSHTYISSSPIPHPHPFIPDPSPPSFHPQILVSIPSFPSIHPNPLISNPSSPSLHIHPSSPSPYTPYILSSTSLHSHPFIPTSTACRLSWPRQAKIYRLPAQTT